MALYILFSLLLLLHVFAAVERKKTCKEMKRLRRQVSELSERQTKTDLWRLNLKSQTEACRNLNMSTPVSPSSTQLEQYSAYLKRGGKDDLQTWLMKSEMEGLFP